jgi:O-antigen ligase
MSGSRRWLVGSALAVLLAGLAPIGGVLVALAGGVFAAGAGTSRPRIAPTRRAVAMPLLAVLARYELAILLAASPFFLFPQPDFLYVLLLVPAQQLVRWWVQGRPTRPSPLNLPILLLLVMLAPAFWLAEPHTALPKLAGLVFGIALYLAIVNGPWRIDTIPLQLLLLGQCLALTVAALLATDWLVMGKLSVYNDIYAQLPHLNGAALPAINPNESGGALAWVVPYVFGSWLREHRAPLLSSERLATLSWRLLLVFVTLLSALALVLTQSRSAIGSVLIAVGVLLALSSPRRLRRLLLVVLALALIAATMWLLNRQLAGAPSPLDGRAEVWLAALTLVGRYPLAGVGLNMFDVALARNGLQLFPPYVLLFAHAHNEFLQSAIDFGLPGLVAFSMLLTVAALSVGRLMRSADVASRGLALAIGCGLLAHQLFGLVDAIALGAKPAFLYWTFLACVARLRYDRELSAALPRDPGVYHDL